MGDMDAAQIRAELRAAFHDLSDRGLMQAAQWAAEHCAALGAPPSAGSPAPSWPRAITAVDEAEEDLFLFVKSCLDMREYRRAANLSAGAKGPRLTFIRLYATYMFGEQQREDRQLEMGGALERAAVPNPELGNLSRELQRIHSSSGLDAFGLYLYGVVLQAMDNRSDARDALIASVSAYPCNWSAWRALESLCPDRAQLEAVAVAVRPHWMVRMFLGHGLVALQQYKDDALALYEESGLLAMFPRSAYLQGQLALAHYHQRDYEAAAELLQRVRRQDPHNLSHVDMLSNILYVSENRPRLAELARAAQATDKYRPETCCVIGNYFSLKHDHERALAAFMRALRLNPSYLAAWTLMGHEFVFLKNPTAAVQAYRRAVDLDPRDFRAWYGLGQTYEILQMPLYALHYYRKAAEQRPNDSRMWMAMATCYENIDRKQSALECYQRAVDLSRDSHSLHRLAALHAALGSEDAAARTYATLLELLDAEGDTGAEAADALLYLAQYSKGQKQYEDAEAYCMRLLEMPGPAREAARSLLRELQSTQSRFDPQ